MEVADRLERLASEDGKLQIHAHASNARSTAYIAARRWADAIREAEHAVAGYEASGMPSILGYARNVHGIALLGQGHIDEAKALLNQARLDGTNVQSARIEGLSLYNLAWAHWMTGRHHDARDAAREAMGVLRRSGGADIEAGERLAEATAAIVEGDKERARAALIGAASASQGNSDLVPPEWLLTEAARLTKDRPGR